MKNRGYYAGDLVRLDEVTFVPLKDTAAVNLYRAGLVHDMSGYSLPSVLLPALQHNLVSAATRRTRSFTC